MGSQRHFNNHLHHNLYSLFVDNIHEDMDRTVLWKYFQWVGIVKDIYIPKKIRQGRRDKFGFVRFSDPREAKHVVAKCNGDYLWGRRLLVNEALYGGVPTSHKVEEYRSINYKGKPPFISNNGNRDSRSYQEALSGFAPNFKHPFIPKDKGFNANSKQIKPNLEYEPKETEKAWRAGCAVGYLHLTTSLSDLKEIFMGMGFYNCSVSPMGGNMVLLAFSSKNEMESAINLNLNGLQQWFDLIKPWDEENSFESRFVWLKCEGIPLHAWNSCFFSLIASLYGRFVKVETHTELKKRLDVARFLIVTSFKDNIIRKTGILVGGRTYTLSIFEDEVADFLKDEVIQCSYGGWPGNLADAQLGRSKYVNVHLSDNTVDKSQPRPPDRRDLAKDNSGLFFYETHRLVRGSEKSNQSPSIQISNSKSPLSNLGATIPTITSPVLEKIGTPCSTSRVHDSLSFIRIPKRKVGFSSVGPTKDGALNLEVVLPFTNRPIDSTVGPSSNYSDIDVSDEDGSESATFRPLSPKEGRLALLEHKLQNRLGKDKGKRRGVLENRMLFGGAGKLIKIKAKVASKSKGLGISANTKTFNGSRTNLHKELRLHTEIASPSNRLSNLTEYSSHPISSDNTRVRNSRTLKEATKCWNLGKKLGLYVNGRDSNGANFMELLDKHDWEEFERRENE